VFLKNRPDRSRNNSLLINMCVCWVSAHRVGLSGSSLAIGEDTHVVAVKKRLNQVLDFAINICLSRFFTENAVKTEKMFDWFLVNCLYLDLLRVWSEDLLLTLSKSGAVVCFVVVFNYWSHPNENPYVALESQILLKQAFLEGRVKVISSVFDPLSFGLQI
jgi:hypothetical protein